MAVILENVPITAIADVKEPFFDTLKKVYNREIPFNETRIQTLLHQKKIRILADLEQRALDIIADDIISFQLYGNSASDVRSPLFSLLMVLIYCIGAYHMHGH